MSSSVMFFVCDNFETVQKARQWASGLGITLKVFSTGQWNGGLGSEQFKKELVTDPNLLTQGTNSLGNVVPFPNRFQNNSSNSSKVSTIEEMESEAIKNAILECRGNLTEAAKALGIGRATIYRKIKQYNIDPNMGRVRHAA